MAENQVSAALRGKGEEEAVFRGSIKFGLRVRFSRSSGGPTMRVQPLQDLSVESLGFRVSSLGFRGIWVGGFRFECPSHRALPSRVRPWRSASQS